ncbi:hypothetical protein Plhal703r1_c43g0143891 [Plasmopara halstedii]
MRCWYCAHASLSRNAELRTRATPFSCTTECARTSQGQAIVNISPSSQTPSVDVDAASTTWLQVTHQDAAIGVAEGIYVLTTLPHNTPLVLPWVPKVLSSCCKLTNSSATLCDGHQKLAQCLGPVEAVKFFYRIVEVKKNSYQLFQPVHQSLRVNKKDLHSLCTWLKHVKCSNPHACYKLCDQLPDYTLNKARTVGLLNREGTVANMRGGSWLRIVDCKAERARMMCRIDNFAFLQIWPTKCSISVGNRSVAEVIFGENDESCKMFTFVFIFANAFGSNHAVHEKVVEQIDHVRNDRCQLVPFEEHVDKSTLSNQYNLCLANNVACSLGVDSKPLNVDHGLNFLAINEVSDQSAGEVDCEPKAVDMEAVLMRDEDKLHFCVHLTEKAQTGGSDILVNAGDKADVLNSDRAYSVCVRAGDLKSNGDYLGHSHVWNDRCHDKRIEEYAAIYALSCDDHLGTENGVKTNAEVKTEPVDVDKLRNNWLSRSAVKAASSEGVDNVDCDHKTVNIKAVFMREEDTLRLCTQAIKKAPIGGSGIYANAGEKADVLHTNCAYSDYVQAVDSQSSDDSSGHSLAKNMAVGLNIYVWNDQCHDIQTEEYTAINALSFDDHLGTADVVRDNEETADVDNLWDNRIISPILPTERVGNISCGLNEVGMNDMLLREEDKVIFGVYTPELSQIKRIDKCLDAEVIDVVGREGPANFCDRADSICLRERDTVSPVSITESSGHSCGVNCCADWKAELSIETEASDIAVLSSLDDTFDSVDELILNEEAGKCEVANTKTRRLNTCSINDCGSHCLPVKVKPGGSEAPRAEFQFYKLGVVEYCVRKRAQYPPHDTLSQALFSADQDNADLVFEALLSDDPLSDEWLHDVVSKNDLDKTSESSEILAQIRASNDTYTLIMDDKAPEAILESSLHDDEVGYYDLVSSFEYPVPRRRHGNIYIGQVSPPSSPRYFQFAGTKDHFGYYVKARARPQSFVSMSMPAVSSGQAQQKTTLSSSGIAKPASALTRPRSFVRSHVM